MLQDDKKLRTALFDAGRRLAERGQLSELNPAWVAREADLSEGDFHALFRDERDYLAGLQQHFLSTILRQVITSLGNHPPGVKRIQASIQAFLDGCLQLRGLRLLLVGMDSNPEMAETTRRRRHAFMEMLRLEFKAAGWAHPAEVARLYRVMVEEAALAEMEAGQPLPAIRHILWQFLRGDAW